MPSLPLILVSPSGAVTHANPAAVDLLGEPHGRRCAEYVRACDPDNTPLCTATCAAQLSHERQGTKDREDTKIRRRPHRLICTAMGGQTVVQMLPHKEPAKSAVLLTAREQEVMERVAEGNTTAVIAKHLGISSATVRTHVEHAREKLGARTRAEAIARLAESGRLGPSK